MKRERDESDNPPCDPVLAQLDFLINGPPKEARAEPPPPAQDPVLAQLDALINGSGASAPAAAAAPPLLPPLPPMPPLLPPMPPAEAEPRGPPGILREFGGVKGWLRARGYATSPTRSTPSLDPVTTNRPSSDQATLAGAASCG
jgi:hypothetical protein